MLLTSCQRSAKSGANGSPGGTGPADKGKITAVGLIASCCALSASVLAAGTDDAQPIRSMTKIPDTVKFWKIGGPQSLRLASHCSLRLPPTHTTHCTCLAARDMPEPLMHTPALELCASIIQASVLLGLLEFSRPTA